ncbi:hypothetical protein H0H93_000102 [Arthromyces matolae]|nr:hypothetical protein H0H93_000102 [Arthromyces matolae]
MFTTKLHLASIFGLLSLPLVCAEDAHYRLYHRLHRPSETQNNFKERATVIISEDNSLAFQFAPTFRQDILSFAETLNEVEDKDSLIYQVALERDGDSKEDQWDVSSVKACHLAESTTEQIYLHVSDIHNPKPYAINYYVSPIPHDGACPKPRSKKKAISLESFAKVNTTVTLKGAHVPPLPQLVAPPPLTPEGEPVVPVQEKTFVQKYWVYIIIAMLAAMLAGPAEEDKPARKE